MPLDADVERSLYIELAAEDPESKHGEQHSSSRRSTARAASLGGELGLGVSCGRLHRERSVRKGLLPPGVEALHGRACGHLMLHVDDIL